MKVLYKVKIYRNSCRSWKVELLERNPCCKYMEEHFKEDQIDLHVVRQWSLTHPGKYKFVFGVLYGYDAILPLPNCPNCGEKVELVEVERVHLIQKTRWVEIEERYWEEVQEDES